MMNIRIQNAIADFNKAKKDYYAAVDARKKADLCLEDFLTTITSGLSGMRERIEARKENENKILEFGAACSKTKEKENLCYAVMLATSQNGADVAGNVFSECARENEKVFSVPVHYKKFESAFASVLPANQFYFHDTGYSFEIIFRDGVYNHNTTWSFSTKNGCLNFADDRTFTKKECTLSEIKKEAKQALKDAQKLRAAVKALKDTRGSYNSHIKHLMPYLDVSPIRDDYRLFGN